MQQVMGEMAGWSAVALLFAAPTSRAVFNAAALFLIIGVCFGGRYIDRCRTAWANPVTLPALLMVLLVILGAVHTSASWVEVWDHWKRYSKFFLIPVLIAVFHDATWRRRAWAAFLLATFIVLCSTYANIWWDLPWSKTSNNGWGQDHSVFANHIAQGLVMSFFVAVSATLGLREKAWPRRTFWLVAASLAAFSVTHLSQGRGGQIALVAVFVVLVARESPVRWRLPALSGLVVVLGILYATSPLLQQRFSEAVTDTLAYESESSYTSAGARLHMWSTSIQLIGEAPIFGHGTGAYHGESARLFNDVQMCAIGCFHPHNQLLFFGVDYGILGMVLFLFFLWRPWRESLKRKDPTHVMLSGFMAVLVVDVLLHGPLWIHMEAYFFFTMLPLLMSAVVHSDPWKLQRCSV
jgi:O-antigen ligase